MKCGLWTSKESWLGLRICATEITVLRRLADVGPCLDRAGSGGGRKSDKDAVEEEMMSAGEMLRPYLGPPSDGF